MSERTAKKNRRLEAENAQLRAELAQLKQATPLPSTAGPTTIYHDPHAEVDLVVPAGGQNANMFIRMEDSEGMTQKAFANGVRTARRYDIAQARLIEGVTRVVQASLCTNGAETRTVIGRAAHELMTAVSQFEAAMSALRREQVLSMNEDAAAKILRYCYALRTCAVEYAEIQPITGTSEYSRLQALSSAALDQLREFISHYDHEARDLLKEIGELREKRGKPRKGNDWLTVEFQKLIEQGMSAQQAHNALDYRLKNSTSAVEKAAYRELGRVSAEGLQKRVSRNSGNTADNNVIVRAE